MYGIVLVGMMGVGKSSVARELASLTGWPSVDTDQVIEHTYDRSISDLFREEGEASFRAKEEAVIHRLLDMRTPLMATGGGAFLNPRLRAHARCSTTLHLTASYETLARRLKNDGTRPLLSSGLRALYHQRAPVYALADVTLSTEGRTPRALALHILSHLGYPL